MALSLALAAGALIGAGCAKPQAKTLPPPPPPAPLNVPAPPPPHVVVVKVPIEVVETPPVVADPATATPPAREKPPATRPTPPPATPPPATAPPDPPVLQTTRTQEDETRARADLIRTEQILSKIDGARIAPELRESFNEANKFKRLAETDLRDKNFASAAAYAVKALTFAQALIKPPAD